MKPSQIRVGATYQNRGAGRTRRTVKAIGEKYVPRHWHSDSKRPIEPGVLYLQDGNEEWLYLSSFASWCGKEVSA